MSSSGSNESSCVEDTFIPFKDRDEWKDVVPLEQDDGPDPIVKIAYTDRFREVHDYFRAIYKSGEISTRAFNLTAEAAELNPANYTVWHQRRVILKGLLARDDLPADDKPDLEDELFYIRTIIEKNPKNYQVWQHRRAIVEMMKNPKRELLFCDIMLSQDSKNYHAWQHRQWVIETFNLYENEIKYLDHLLTEDIRNNSAWNQRFFVVSKTLPNGQFKGEVFEAEVDYVLDAIKRAPDNESSWNYLQGLMDRCEDDEQQKLREIVSKFCKELYENDSDNPSPHLVAAMIDLMTEKMENMSTGEDQQKKSLLENAKQLCHSLAEEHDTVRQEYWRYLDRDLTNRFGNSDVAS